MVISRITALAVLALGLAACSDSSSLAPTRTSSVAQAALPQAARYIVSLSSPGNVPSSLAAAITARGGHIVRSHAGTGMVVVAGLSAAAATSLRQQADVGAVLADMHRKWIHEQSVVHVSASQLRGSGKAAPVHALGSAASAPFYTSGQEWYITTIGADTAWSESSQGSGQTVYILDTGVDTAHQDLTGKVNTKLSTSFATAPSGDSVLPFGHDVFGHGTFVSSLVTTNSVGIAAVAPQAKIVMVRVLNDSGSGFDSDILSGLLYAADSGAKVISMSLGGYLDRTSGGDLAFADLFQKAVDYATARGALIVAAAGNDAVNTNTALSGTASYADSLDVPAGLHYLISVGAIGPIAHVNPDQIAQYSNFGSADVAVFAPGGNDEDQTYESEQNPQYPDWVIGACSSASDSQCAGENQYVVDIGTSMATPMVAATGAVLLAGTSSLSPAAVESCILNSATAQGTGKGDVNWNFGIISVPSSIAASGC
jgi:lantibiotic leader peptide-processing serine protease